MNTGSLRLNGLIFSSLIEESYTEITLRGTLFAMPSLAKQMQGGSLPLTSPLSTRPKLSPGLTLLMTSPLRGNRVEALWLPFI